MNVPRQALLMLAYLYNCRQPMPQKDLAAFLWPGDLQAAGANLRSALLRLASATPKSSRLLISGVATSLALNFDALRCDLDAVENASGVARLGALADALAEVATALELNPLAPDYYYWTAAGASYFLGEYTEALAYLDRMRDPGPASRLAAASWAMQGDLAKAASWRAKGVRVAPRPQAFMSVRRSFIRVEQF
ncbi:MULTISPECIES: hypothetical protein [unclassified Rhizobium]|uniref:hypothetical protein n=1 Tax=unclassified Rhizobium TaxID=2613769 RepID=UPI001FEFA1B8|nr:MULTISPECIES: hypothetical protein [unclassified Rhizobium]